MSAIAFALGDMPSQSERAEAGKLAVSIVELVRRGSDAAADLHALVSTVTLREYAHKLGAMGALICAFADQLDQLVVAAGLAWQSGDVIRQACNAIAARRVVQHFGDDGYHGTHR